MKVQRVIIDIIIIICLVIIIISSIKMTKECVIEWNRFNNSPCDLCKERGGLVFNKARLNSTPIFTIDNINLTKMNTTKT